MTTQHMFTFAGADSTQGIPVGTAALPVLVRTSALPGDKVLSMMVFSNSNPSNGFSVGQEVGVANFSLVDNSPGFFVQAEGVNFSGVEILTVVQRG